MAEAVAGDPTCALSVVVPCYNEEENVEELAGSLASALAGLDYELILVDNGSADRTGERLRRAALRNPRIRLARVPINRGYGHGVRTGLSLARGAHVGWIDADLQVDPASLRHLHAALADGRGDFAVAQRQDRADGLRRRVASLAYNALARLLLGTAMADVNGKPKLLRRADLAALDLQSDDWFVDTELVVKLCRLGRRAHLAPVASRPRRHGRSNVRAATVREFLVRLAQMRSGRLPPGAALAAHAETTPVREQVVA